MTVSQDPLCDRACRLPSQVSARRHGILRSHLGVWSACLLLQVAACGTHPTSPTHESLLPHEQKLLRMVRQDCGSCHGMQMTGGLGPALTPEALRDWSIENLSATIYHGRPGTPMPGWKALISESDAQWISRQLKYGLPPG